MPKIDFLISHARSIRIHGIYCNHAGVHKFRDQFVHASDLYVLTYFTSKEILRVIEKFSNLPLAAPVNEAYLGQSYYSLSNQDFENNHFAPFNIFHKEIFVHFKANPDFYQEIINGIYKATHLAEQFIYEQSQLEHFYIQKAD